MSATRDVPRAPYVLLVLDGVCATYAGVSPNEPIGEPVQRAFEIMLEALRKGYEVRVLTWRDTGVVWAWMLRAKLLETFSAKREFSITNEMPNGLPICWVTTPIHLSAVADLEDRRPKRERAD